MSLNKVILVGNLTRDPELKHLPKGTAVARLCLAINRRWRTEAGERRDETTFVDVETFGRTAENCAQYVAKGSAVLVEGRLKLEQWDDKATGQRRARLAVVGETVQFLSRREGEKAAAPATDADAPAASDDVPF
jgi:single-strand DNA-binding protein